MILVLLSVVLFILEQVCLPLNIMHAQIMDGTVDVI